MARESSGGVLLVSANSRPYIITLNAFQLIRPVGDCPVGDCPVGDCPMGDCPVG